MVQAADSAPTALPDRDAPPPPTRSSTPPPSLARELAAVALGGALGASLRALLGRVASAIGIPAAGGTLLVNVTGAFVLGLVLARFGLSSDRPLLRPFWVIGVLGSYTTFSTVTLESRALAEAFGRPAGLALLAGSIGLGLLGFTLGFRLSGRAA